MKYDLSLKEKITLLEGHSSWFTAPLEARGLPPLYMTDGPLGVRKRGGRQGSMLGSNNTLPSTAFPAPAALAQSWDGSLAERVGAAIGRECAAYGVHVLLAPGMNIKRDPRCGRNFEYFSEDPLLSGEMAASYVRGVQSRGVCACIKHFAMNNGENFRYMGDSQADMRAIREIYLRGFELAVRRSAPGAVMCSYNRINGVQVSESHWLLEEMLRENWGFDGIVMTDWGATRDRARGVAAGVDLDMPGGVRENRASIRRALEAGTLPGERVETCAERMAAFVRRWHREPSGEDMARLLPEHAPLAVEAALACAVLLENDGTLPLDSGEPVTVLGELFGQLRYQGAGSSDLAPPEVISPREAFDRAGVTYRYLRDGIGEGEPPSGPVLFFGGLTEATESEGYDREHLRLPQDQLEALRALAEAGIRPVLVLFGGAPMELPEMAFAAVLYMNLPGQGGGEAARRLIFGGAEPRGHLAESWVRTTGDIAFGSLYSRSPCELYRENIFVGYRFYGLHPQRVRYPFGHGLDYGCFVWESMALSAEGDRVRAAVRLTNRGPRPGRQLVQLYAGDPGSSAVFRAPMALLAFGWVELEPGQSGEVQLDFPLQALAYYHGPLERWVLESGSYPIHAAASAGDVRLTEQLPVTGDPPVDPPYDREVTEAYCALSEEGISDALVRRTLPGKPAAPPPVTPYTLESPLADFRHTAPGRWVYRLLFFAMRTQRLRLLFFPRGEVRDAEVRKADFVEAIFPRNSLRSMVQSSGGLLQMGFARGMLALANGQPGRAVAALFGRK